MSELYLLLPLAAFVVFVLVSVDLVRGGSRVLSCRELEDLGREFDSRKLGTLWLYFSQKLGFDPAREPGTLEAGQARDHSVLDWEPCLMPAVRPL